MTTSGGNTEVLRVWGRENGPYMQALHFCFSLGALLGPLVTEPFLVQPRLACYDVSGANDTGHSFSGQTTKTANALTTSVVNSFEMRPENATTQCVEIYNKSEIGGAFWIAAGIVFSSSMGFLHLFVKQKTTSADSDEDKSVKDTEDYTRKDMPMSLKVVVLILLCVLFGAYNVVEDGFVSFLATFLHAQFAWAKSDAAYATAVFWIAFASGRFLGIFTVSFCSVVKLLTASLGLVALGTAGFLTSTLLRAEPAIWVAIAFLGFVMSVIFPAIFCWTSEHVLHVSGKISGLFLVASSVAGMSVPLLTGHLMEYFTPMWLPYVHVIVTLTCCMIFALIRVLLRAFRHRDVTLTKQ